MICASPVPVLCSWGVHTGSEEFSKHLWAPLYKTLIKPLCWCRKSLSGLREVNHCTEMRGREALRQGQWLINMSSRCLINLPHLVKYFIRLVISEESCLSYQAWWKKKILNLDLNSKRTCGSGGHWPTVNVILVFPAWGKDISSLPASHWPFNSPPWIPVQEWCFAEIVPVAGHLYIFFSLPKFNSAEQLFGSFLC